MHINFQSRRFKLILFLSSVLIVYHFIIRPWMLDWGAPARIEDRNLSGDYFTGGPRHTRAVLIQASPQEIWPWILQLGQERGGFYSYTWLENIFFADMHNVYVMKSELQQPRITGDTIWLASRNNYSGKGYQIVAQVITHRAFVMVSGEDYARIQSDEKANGSWAIYLYPESDGSTWLIARSSGGPTTVTQQLLRYFTFELPHFIMEQKMLRTIRLLAEKK